MAQDNDTTLQIQRFINAPVEQVYSAWTQVDLIKRWFAPGNMSVPQASVDLQPNGQYRIQMFDAEEKSTHTCLGVYQQIVPGKKLVFTWTWEGNETEQSLVTVTFAAKNQGTELTLIHERFSDKNSRDMHEQGWHGCLVNLENCLKK